MSNIKQAIYTPATVPDGTYSGLWGGYIVNFEHNGQKYSAQVDKGVRGMNVPCNIVIENGVARIA